MGSGLEEPAPVFVTPFDIGERTGRSLFDAATALAFSRAFDAAGWAFFLVGLVGFSARDAGAYL